MNIWKQKYLEMRKKAMSLMIENEELSGMLEAYRYFYHDRPIDNRVRYIEIDDYTFVETSYASPEAYEVLDDTATVVAHVSLESSLLVAKYLDDEDDDDPEIIFSHKFIERDYKGTFDNTTERMLFLGEIAKVLSKKLS